MIGGYLQRLESFGGHDALALSDGGTLSYSGFVEEVRAKAERFRQQLPQPGLVNYITGWHRGCLINLLALLQAGQSVVLSEEPVPTALSGFVCIILHQEKLEKNQRFRQLPSSVSSNPQQYLGLLTSGTSGQPKVPMYDSQRLLASYTGKENRYRMLPLMQFAHFGGLDPALRTISNGGTLCLPENLHPHLLFSSEVLIHLQLDVISATPSYFRLALAAAPSPLPTFPSVKRIIFGGEKPSEVLANRLQKIVPHAQFRYSFATTEAGLVSMSKNNRYRSENLKVQEGKLLVKHNPLVAFRLGEETNQPQEWEETGDLAEETPEGIRILGRSSRTINTGGYKVQPEEVEAVLQTVPGVDDVRVSGQPNPLLGQVVVAEMASSQQPQDIRKAVLQKAQEELPQYARPVKVVVKQELELTPRWKK